MALIAERWITHLVKWQSMELPHLSLEESDIVQRIVADEDDEEQDEKHMDVPGGEEEVNSLVLSGTPCRKHLRPL
jgi:hypothetical protein